MNTVQIVGIAVASAIVLVLIIALIVTRDRGEARSGDPQPSPEEKSFLDDAPREDFHRLGRAEPDAETTGEVPMPAMAAPDEPPQAAPPASEPTFPVSEVTPPAAEPAEKSLTDTAGPPPAGNLIPLSDIIVTTSDKLVDLSDTEVRRMLKELVGYEIDQAAQFKAMGQHVDAVLQLTEAEKICLALDMHTQARQIRAMMRELRD